MPGGEHFAAHALGRDGFTSEPAILEFHWCIFKYARLNARAATPRERCEGLLSLTHHKKVAQSLVRRADALRGLRPIVRNGPDMGALP